MLLETLLSKVAAAGVVAKAAAGGTAVVLAASAAGATDSLPDSAQETFDGLVATETVELDEESGAEAEAETETGGETDENAAFGEGVSQDATGESDDEAGVEGAAIACEASEGRSGTCTETTDVAAEDADATGDAGDFGARVSADATGEDGSEPGVDGEQISSEARSMDRGEGQEGGDDLSSTTADEDDSDADLDEEEEEEEEETDADRGPEGTPGEAAASNRPSDEG